MDTRFTPRRTLVGAAIGLLPVLASAGYQAYATRRDDRARCTVTARPGGSGAATSISTPTADRLTIVTSWPGATRQPIGHGRSRGNQRRAARRSALGLIA